MLGEMLGERGLARDRFHHVPATFLVVLRIPLGTDLFVIALVPILLHPAQGIEVLIPQTEFAGTVLFRLLGRGRFHRLGGAGFHLFEQRVGRHFIGDFTQ